MSENSNIVKNRLSWLVSIAGIIVAITSVFIAFETDRKNEIRKEFLIEIERLEKVNKKLLEENRILREILQKQDLPRKNQEASSLDLQIVSQNLGNSNEIFGYDSFAVVDLLQVQDDDTDPQQVDNETTLVNPSVPASNPIITGIYSLLGAILFISSLVTLFAEDKDRKETALEITKTLITFFIGAATGGN